MSCTVLHHVEICVKEESKVLTLLINGFGFHLFAYRLTPRASKWVLRSGNSVFIITKRNSLLGCIDEENYGFNAKLNNGSETTTNSENNAHAKSGLKIINNDCRGSEPTRNHYCIEEPLEIHQQYNEHWTVFCCRGSTRHTIDSVFNVALVVKDVDGATEKVRSQGAQVLREPADISDAFGHVRYSIVSSSCGNIVHTLIDIRNYKGSFLPGYEAAEKCAGTNCSTGQTNNVKDNKKHHINCIPPVNTCNSLPVMQETIVNEVSKQIYLQNLSAPLDKMNIFKCSQGAAHNTTMTPISTYIDHITFVCDVGKSHELISWYEHCFGMKRFITNSKESEEDGFVLGGDIGLRLKALEYWKCAETGLAIPTATMDDFSLKLVIAEALPNVSKSHVNTFLQAHKGPGVQHIGLHTTTMTATVKYMTDNGVIFRKPPPVYYEEGIKLEDIKESGHGEEIELFQELGILLDTEEDVFTDIEANQGKKRYLMQVFTGPIFEEDTFFLEIIQRCGATGFGAGNIKALARSIVLYKQQLESSGLRE